MPDPILLDGTATAKTLRQEVTVRARRLKETAGIVPGLAAVLAGDNPASVTYVAMKRRACERAGITSVVHEFGSGATTDVASDVYILERPRVAR